MFCSKCGQQIAEDAIFCSACGEKVKSIDSTHHQEQIQVQNQVDVDNITSRSGEIQLLDTAFNYFVDKKLVFDEYNEVCNSLIYYARGTKNSIIVWGLIILMGAFVPLLIGTLEGLIASLILFLLPGTTMILGGILMKVNNRIKYNYYLQMYNELYEDLYEFYLKYSDCPISSEYCHPDVLNILIDILKMGKANTIKEAVNVFLVKSNSKKYLAYSRALENATKTSLSFAEPATFNK